ncbi:hypothetical protein [Streptomyces sp. NBC_00892]|uniref:hypothetical protein n=1 Tax=Streptomyces sp. NBC_00892 TaxID=2975861 RepID=UPI00225036B1|nr:hypothetical protein [Streptomyces sp. NBC_00892]MCX4902322.1 hypothetical protein [Streptomyces sp. NBC_00892]
MRPIIGTDVIAFYDSRCDLLVLTAAGEYNHVDRDAVTSSSRSDGGATAYDYVTIGDDDSEVQVLLSRDSLIDGDWFPDALTDDGRLVPAVADEMAGIINQDGILPSRALKAVAAGEAWAEAERHATDLAARRAAAVAEVVAYCGNNQSKAGRLLGLDQSTVNKLMAKHRRTTVVTGTLTESDSADILHTIAASGIDTSDLNAPVSTAGTGYFTRKTRRGVLGNSITAEEGAAINGALTAAGWATTSAGPALTVLHRPV